MRFYTYNVGAQLVRELDIAGAVKHIIHDGGDIIHLELLTGDSLMVYLIESPIPLYEIRKLVQTNTARGDHTLFILWGNMLLPGDGRVVEIEDWHEGLMHIYGDLIYAYGIHHHEVMIYPVHFQRIGRNRARIKYGARIDVGAISSHHIDCDLIGFEGRWHIAAFAGDPEYFHRQQAAKIDLPADLGRYYALLQVQPDAELGQVKQAYRTLARRHHPDLNRHDPTANEQMQALNHAYNAILKARTEAAPNA